MLLALAVLIVLIWLIRAASPHEIDDMTPGIPCKIDIVEKSDILWVIPIYRNESIANNLAWCEYISSLGKQLQLHGVQHTFEEFSYPRTKEYLQQGVIAFEECFNQTPSKFKPPQLAYTNENDQILEEFNLKRKGLFNQFFHKVYHCQDTGLFPNKFIDWF